MLCKLSLDAICFGSSNIHIIKPDIILVYGRQNGSPLWNMILTTYLYTMLLSHFGFKCYTTKYVSIPWTYSTVHQVLSLDWIKSISNYTRWINSNPYGQTNENILHPIHTHTNTQTLIGSFSNLNHTVFQLRSLRRLATRNPNLNLRNRSTRQRLVK